MNKFGIVFLLIAYFSLVISIAELIGWILQGNATINQFAEYYIWGVVLAWLTAGIGWSWWIALLVMIPITLWVLRTDFFD